MNDLVVFPFLSSSQSAIAQTRYDLIQGDITALQARVAARDEEIENVRHESETALSTARSV